MEKERKERGNGGYGCAVLCCVVLCRCFVFLLISFIYLLIMEKKYASHHLPIRNDYPLYTLPLQWVRFGPVPAMMHINSYHVGWDAHAYFMSTLHHAILPFTASLHSYSSNSSR